LLCESHLYGKNHKNNNMNKEKLIGYGINLAIVTVGVLLALKIKEGMNQVKVLPPAQATTKE